jgi:hypothetical protein
MDNLADVQPTNASPGLIYMLNGAAQRSYTDPFDRTSPAIPIGPHWMILWPLDAKLARLPTVMRDGGTMVMFAGTPYAHPMSADHIGMGMSITSAIELFGR